MKNNHSIFAYIFPLLCACVPSQEHNGNVDKENFILDTIPLDLSVLTMDTIYLDDEILVFPMPKGFIKKHECNSEAMYYYYYYLSTEEPVKIGSILMIGKGGLHSFFPWDTLNYSQIWTTRDVLCRKTNTSIGVFRKDTDGKRYFSYYGYMPTSCELYFDKLLDSLATQK